MMKERAANTPLSRVEIGNRISLEAPSWLVECGLRRPDCWVWSAGRVSCGGIPRSQSAGDLHAVQEGKLRARQLEK